MPKPSYPTAIDTANPLADHLVHSWIFNEGSGTIVHDGAASGAVHGVANGTYCTWTTDGDGPQMAMAGADQPRVVLGGTVTLTPPFAVAFRLARTGGAELFGDWNLGDYDGVGIDSTPGLNLQHGSYIKTFASSPADYATKRDYLIAHDGTDLRLYVDGVAAGSPVGDGAGPWHLSALGVRGNKGSTDYALIGTFDYLHLYSASKDATFAAALDAAPYGMYGAGADATAPTATAAAIDAAGTTLAVTFSEAVTGGTGFALPGYTLGTASGSGSSRSFAVTPAVAAGLTVTLSYAPGDVADAAGNPLASFSGRAVANDSTAAASGAGTLDAPTVAAIAAAVAACVLADPSHKLAVDAAGRVAATLDAADVAGNVSANVLQVLGQEPVPDATLATLVATMAARLALMPTMAAGLIVAGSTTSSVIVSGLPAGRSFVGQHLYYPAAGESRTIASQSFASGNYTFAFTGTAGTVAGPFSAVTTGDPVVPSP